MKKNVVYVLSGLSLVILFSLLPLMFTEKIILEMFLFLSVIILYQHSRIANFERKYQVKNEFVSNLSQIQTLIDKELEKQRETFIATLSHDLKTPTIAQIRSLELLLNGDFGEFSNEQRSMINLTLDSCKYMYEMVSTVLSTYKYENGEIQLDKKNFDIETLCNECYNDAKKLMEEKNLTVKVDNSKLRTNLVKADKIQIKKVITNILANSFSYAYKNSEISIFLENNDEGDFIFKVKNISPYIEAGLMENLFKKYTTHASKFNKVGDGLALYLAKQIVEKHDGKIIAKNYDNEVNILGFILKTSVPLNFIPAIN
ncbi:HAMP domain-containing histidine kinase [bacterium]|nr:HAMP domain-containing histidine kinase [bacterium]